MILRIFVILILINNSNCYIFNKNYLWKYMSKPFKEKAREWFINRAENKGIRWREITNFYQSKFVKKKLDIIFSDLDNNMTYPKYYTKSFHGYDEGNLNWLASYENEASTISMSSRYFKDTSPENSSLFIRKNFTDKILSYSEKMNFDNVLDVGCSIGISTEYLNDLIPGNKNITGLDLSPYFISVAKFNNWRKKLNIDYIFENAEDTKLKNNSFDLICSSFMFHEVPPQARKNIIKEMKRLLKPGGIISILDLDPEKLLKKLKKDNWRKVAFESTEPHIYTYYDCNMIEELSNFNLKNILKFDNDPYNSVWICKK